MEFYDPADDELGIAHKEDTRRPRLTMFHLQKLRKARDVSKLEKAEHLNFLPDMYGQPAGGDMGGMGGGMPPADGGAPL